MDENIIGHKTCRFQNINKCGNSLHVAPFLANAVVLKYYNINAVIYKIFTGVYRMTRSHAL